MTIGIYKISHGDRVIYVGQSRDVDRRIGNHKLYMAKNDTRHENKYLCNVAQKYGIEAFSFSLVEDVGDISKLTEREAFWIRELGYPKGNYAIPKEGDDWTVSEDFIDSYLRGKNNPNYGNKWTEQQKAAASKRMTGRYVGEHNPNYGNRGAKNPLTKHICPYNTAEELAEKLREVGGFCALSKELSVPRASVQIWCENFGIPYKKRDYSNFGVGEPTITKEEFLEMNRTLTYAQMAERLGVSKWAIEKWRDALEIKKRR